MAFDDSALTENLDGAVKPKSYFIFSFDQKPLTALGAAALLRPQEELALTGGPHRLRRTIVSVRGRPRAAAQRPFPSMMIATCNGPSVRSGPSVAGAATFGIGQSQGALNGED